MYDSDCRFTHCAALHRRTNSNRRDAVRRQEARDRLRHAGAARLVVLLAVAPERERVEDPEPQDLVARLIGDVQPDHQGFERIGQVVAVFGRKYRRWIALDSVRNHSQSQRADR